MRRSRRTRGVCLLLSALTFGSPGAFANVAAAQRPPRPTGSIGVEPGTELAVERQLLEIECSGEASVSCRFVATYFLVNPTSAPVEAVAAFWGEASQVRLAWGTTRERELDPEELDRIVDAFSTREPPHPALPRPQAVGNDLRLEPGARGRLVASGFLDLGWAGHPGHGRDAVHARHRVLQPPPSSEVLLASYYVAPIRSFRASGPITVRTRWPEHLALELSYDTANARAVPLPLDRDRQGHPSAEVTFSSDSAVLLHVVLRSAGRWYPGGPFVGLGGAFGQEGGLRLRAGYEVAAPPWLLYALSAETDAARRLVVTPLVEAASPNVLFLPSLGFGLGAPVKLRPEVAFGGRAQATLGLYSLGIVGSFDLYPRQRGLPQETEFSLLGQLWL